MKTLKFIAVHFLSRVQNIKSLSSIKWLLSSKFLHRIQKIFFIKPLLNFVITLSLVFSPFSYAPPKEYYAYSKKENIEYMTLLINKRAKESSTLMEFAKSFSSIPKAKQKEIQNFLKKEKWESLSVSRVKIKNNKLLVGERKPAEFDFRKADKGIVLVNGKSVQVKGKSVLQIADQIKKVLIKKKKYDQEIFALHLIQNLILPKSEAVTLELFLATVLVVGVMGTILILGLLNDRFMMPLSWHAWKHKKASMERIRLLLENNSDFRLTSLTCDRHERLLSFDYQDVSDYENSSSKTKTNISYKLAYELEKRQLKREVTPPEQPGGLEKVERYLNGNLFCKYYHNTSNPYKQKENIFQKSFESNQFICDGGERDLGQYYYKKNISDRNASYVVLYGSFPYLFLMDFCCGRKECRDEIRKHKNIKFVDRAKN